MQGKEGLSTYEQAYICVTNHKSTTILTVLLALMGALLAVGILVSIKARNTVHTDLNKSKALGYLIFLITICAVIALIFLLSVPSLREVQIVATIGFTLLVSSIDSVAIMFIPKFMDIYTFGTEGSDMSSKIMSDERKETNDASHLSRDPSGSCKTCHRGPESGSVVVDVMGLSPAMTNIRERER